MKAILSRGNIVGVTIQCITLFITGLSGCADKSVKVSLGEEFVLACGQSVSFDSVDMKIKFIDITQDNRRPSDVVSIQPGQVSCLLEITLMGSASSVILTQSGLTLTEPMGVTNAEEIQQVGDYTFLFNVIPYPISTRKIRKGEYRLRLMVTKSDIRAALGMQFAIALGESASIGSENLKVEFIDVT